MNHIAVINQDFPGYTMKQRKTLPCRSGHESSTESYGNFGLVEPACQVADLPPVDLIVLSHYHGDHFDDVAARDLDKDLPIISTYDAVGKLGPLGFGHGYPLDTWDSHQVEKGEARLKVMAMPGLHASDDDTAAL